MEKIAAERIKVLLGEAKEAWENAAGRWGDTKLGAESECIKFLMQGQEALTEICETLLAQTEVRDD